MKLPPISIRLDPDVKAALQAMATAQERSLSWVATKALRQWMAVHARDRRGTAWEDAPSVMVSDPEGR